MFCYNCGKQIYNGMQKCPYCNISIDTSAIKRLILENTWSDIAGKCPNFTEQNSRTFEIDGKEIIISGEDYIFAHIRSFINNLYNQTYQTLSDYYDHGSFDTLVKDGEQFVNSKLNNIGNAILGFKYQNSGAITEDDKVAFLMLMKRAEFAWAPIYSVAEEFDDLKDVLSERRKSMNVEKTSQWIGGGVGISGAIKGKIQADMLNAGASVANSIGNLARRSIQAGIDRANINKLKKEIKSSSELKDAVFSEIKLFFEDWINTLSAIFLNDRKKHEKVQTQMIYMLDEDTSLTYSDALDVLSNNPYSILAYSTIYYHNPRLGERLSQMAQFLGMSEIILPTFLEADKLLFNEGKINLPSIGFDTDESELYRIKDILTELEKNNPVYVLDVAVFKNEDTIKEQRYHKKVEELISLIEIEKAKKVVAKTLEKNSLKEASAVLLKKRNYCIDNLIFNKYLRILHEEGSNAFIAKFDSEMPQLATDALLIHLHQKQPSKYDLSLETVAGLEHPFIMAYYGECCFKASDDYRQIGIDYLLKAAKYNCAVGLRYLGIFYKNGLAGFYRDSDIAKSYFSIASALGDYEATAEM